MLVTKSLSCGAVLYEARRREQADSGELERRAGVAQLNVAAEQPRVERGLPAGERPSPYAAVGLASFAAGQLALHAAAGLAEHCVLERSARRVAPERWHAFAACSVE